MRKNPPSDLLTAVVALLLLFNVAEFMRASGNLIVMLTMSRMMFTPEIAEQAAAGNVTYEKVRAVLWSVAIWQSAQIVVRGLSIGALSFLLIRKRYAFWCYAGTVVAVYFVGLWGGKVPWKLGYDLVGLAVLVVVLCFTERRLFRLVRKRRAKESRSYDLEKKAPRTTSGTFRASHSARREKNSSHKETGAVPRATEIPAPRLTGLFRGDTVRRKTRGPIDTHRDDSRRT